MYAIRLRIFNIIIIYITISTAVATDRNIFGMSTVVSAPAEVTTVENVSLCPRTRYAIKPDTSTSGTVSISQGPANVPSRTPFTCKLTTLNTSWDSNKINKNHFKKTRINNRVTTVFHIKQVQKDLIERQRNRIRLHLSPYTALPPRIMPSSALFVK